MNDIYIGIMSGTSLDGVDCVAVDFSFRPPKIVAWSFHPFETHLRDRLLDLLRPDWCGGLNEIGHLDAELGETYAAAVLSLIEEHALPADKISAIGCHGQTVCHAPEQNPPFSMQLGDPNRIAQATGITVVADFRRRDIAAGGQGAPLVPAFHQDIFYSPIENRVILNIGGIANITRLAINEPVTGFDTGPGNILMDLWIQEHRGENYDRDGAWAASGIVQDELLQTLLDDPYFRHPPPKSTGREHFNLEWLGLQLQDPMVTEKDIQATISELTAASIALAIQTYAAESQSLYVCGGGAFNKHLMQRLVSLLPSCKVDTTASLGIPPDQVEAVAFAWLARQTLRGNPGNLPSVTGANHHAVLGGIYPGRK
jgi:anhydro-N-acetylmuramic acid kinase